MDRLFITLTLFCLSFTALSQNGNFSFGARQSAMGATGTTLTDQWSVFNNCAGIADLNHTSPFVGYRSAYQSAAFSAIAGGFIYPTKWFTSAMHIYRFGDQYYNQQRIGLTLGNTLDFVSLGASIHYVQYHVESQGNRGTLLIDLGGIVRIIPTLHFGAFIGNVNQPSISSVEHVPVLLRAGLSYRPLESLMVNMELEKYGEYEEYIKMGLEYQVHPLFALRTGFHTITDKITVGFGLSPGKFQFDYAFTNQASVGSVHEFSLGLTLQKDE